MSRKTKSMGIDEAWLVIESAITKEVERMTARLPEDKQTDALELADAALAIAYKFFSDISRIADRG